MWKSFFLLFCPIGYQFISRFLPLFKLLIEILLCIIGLLKEQFKHLNINLLRKIVRLPFYNLLLHLFAQITPCGQEFLILRKSRYLQPFFDLDLRSVLYPAGIFQKEIMQPFLIIASSQREQPAQGRQNSVRWQSEAERYHKDPTELTVPFPCSRNCIRYTRHIQALSYHCCSVISSIVSSFPHKSFTERFLTAILISHGRIQQSVAMSLSGKTVCRHGPLLQWQSASHHIPLPPAYHAESLPV